MGNDEYPWLTVLTNPEIEILSSHLESGLIKLMYLKPGENDMWHENCDLVGDLHLSWTENHEKRRKRLRGIQ